MFKLFNKKPEFPTALFVFISLTALISLPILFYILKNSLADNTGAKKAILDKETYDKFYKTNDPFITKAPSLKDFITGPILSPNDPSLGPAGAPITIVEFSDFACGFCRNQEKTISQIMDKHNDKVRLVWKDFPNNNPGSLSYQAAVAARCAWQQNNFWPYHDLLYEKNQNLNRQAFMEIAGELKLNSAKFEKCFDNAEMKNFIDDNIKEGNLLDIGGVPLIFINKQELMGEIAALELEKIIKEELNKPR